MHKGLRLNRLALAVVLVAGCLPLFIGLGRADLETDEAAYSFAVDRMLEIGDWLAPRLSPSENEIFLEKPPLKFWLVAAPIKAGLLPHNEFGLRFWDAVAGGAAFLYVFAIGSLLAGPVCGVVAVLILFTHWPLVFAHGLRTNNMEAPLVLSYCGGLFHVLRSVGQSERSWRSRHLYFAALYFVLGFMTKFVAVIFLPVIVVCGLVLFEQGRRHLVEMWRSWLGAAALTLALCAPWFIYAQIRFGNQLWETMLAQHVVTRMRTYLDPTHVHPWNFYLHDMWRELTNNRIQWIVAGGCVALIVQTIRRRWFEGAIVLLWGVIPIAAISAGNSKLYHYLFPFLPPVALAGGYVVALIAMLAPAQLRKLLSALEELISRRVPAVAASAGSPTFRRVASLVVVVSATIALITVFLGPIRLAIDGTVIFKSGGIERPALLIALFALATRTSAKVSSLLVALVLLGWMPLEGYRAQLKRLDKEVHPMRTAAECVRNVQASTRASVGLLVDLPEGVWHPLYYYFRRVQPLTYAATPLDPAVALALQDPAQVRPVLISSNVWREYAAKLQSAPSTSEAPALSPPMVTFLNSVLLLPGPYAACSSEAPVRITS